MNTSRVDDEKRQLQDDIDRILSDDDVIQKWIPFNGNIDEPIATFIGLSLIYIGLLAFTVWGLCTIDFPWRINEINNAYIETIAVATDEYGGEHYHFTVNGELYCLWMDQLQYSELTLEDIQGLLDYNQAISFQVFTISQHPGKAIAEIRKNDTVLLSVKETRRACLVRVKDFLLVLGLANVWMWGLGIPAYHIICHPEKYYFLAKLLVRSSARRF